MRAVVPVVLGVATLLPACAASNQPVPLSGNPADLSQIEGEWAGEYHSYEASGRSGTIYFRLEAGQDTATGDVLMHIEGSETFNTVPGYDPWEHVAESRLLSITFVQAAGGAVSGRLDPYEDPICGCEMSTTFTGRVKGNLIEGTYTSQHVNGGDPSTGRWRVYRSFRD